MNETPITALQETMGITAPNERMRRFGFLKIYGCELKRQRTTPEQSHPYELVVTGTWRSRYSLPGTSPELISKPVAIGCRQALERYARANQLTITQ